MSDNITPFPTKSSNKLITFKLPPKQHSDEDISTFWEIVGEYGVSPHSPHHRVCSRILEFTAETEDDRTLILTKDDLNSFDLMCRDLALDDDLEYADVIRPIWKSVDAWAIFNLMGNSKARNFISEQLGSQFLQQTRQPPWERFDKNENIQT
jgi:hypothetical protein